MELQFFGANCVGISYKGAQVMVDDTLMELGLKKPAAKPGSILLFTGAHEGEAREAKLVIDRPGDYEVAEVSIKGIAARSHMDEPGKQSATIYKIGADDLSVVCLGHIHPDINEQQLEAIGLVDILFVPVGGNGYTLDPTGAAEMIKKLEPKLVVPTHYADPSLKFPVPQQTLEQALKELGIETKEKVAKLKPKPSDLTDTTQLVVLERS